MKYRKKPIEVLAHQFFSDTWYKDAPPELRPHIAYDSASDTFVIETLEGFHIVKGGDWIIQGIKGELYPCKPDIFELTYEEAP